MRRDADPFGDRRRAPTPFELGGRYLQEAKPAPSPSKAQCVPCRGYSMNRLGNKGRGRGATGSEGEAIRRGQKTCRTVQPPARPPNGVDGGADSNGTGGPP